MLVTESNEEISLSLKLYMDNKAKSLKLAMSFSLVKQTDFELVLRFSVRGHTWANSTAFYTDMNGVTV